MGYSVTDVLEVQYKDEIGIEINIGINEKSLYTDIGSIRIKVKNEHYQKLKGLETVIKNHIKKHIL